MVLFSPHSPIGHQPYPVIYVVTNPIRGLRQSSSWTEKDKRNIYKESSNESKKNVTKQNIIITGIILFVLRTKYYLKKLLGSGLALVHSRPTRFYLSRLVVCETSEGAEKPS